jgi:hypothetical protein
VNGSHANQSYARISQFTLNESFNLFAKSLSDSTAMMLEPALLQHFTSGKTVENIRKMVAGVAPD